MHEHSLISNHSRNRTSPVAPFRRNRGVFFKPLLQPKLTVNQPNDIYEQEADAVADQVMRMPVTRAHEQSFFQPAISSLQRKCTHCEEEERRMQRKEADGQEANPASGIEKYVDNLHNDGQPLSAAARNFFEPRFGRDFGNVKIHTGNVAAKSAQSINALAYTTGNHIVFNDGQYSPGNRCRQEITWT